MKNIFLILFLIFSMNSSFAEEDKEVPNIKMFQDWLVSCNPNNKPCIANQTIRNDDGLPIALINITHISKNTILEFGLPLMMNLQIPIKVEVDDKPIASYYYNTCSQSACFVITNNDFTLVDAFKSGNIAKVIAENIQRKKINLIFSLKGFSKAFSKTY